MSFDTRQQAHDAIADVLWWLKGFRAAQPESTHQEAEADDMIAGLYRVQQFLTEKIEGDAA